MIELLQHALLITGFVFVMMLVIEYINVLTRGTWERTVRQRRWGQCVFAALLGVVPGCLGAYAVVSLYAHRVVTFGAVLACMIATCGDEAFVMLALFPAPALLVFGALLVLGIVVGVLTDCVLKGRRTAMRRHLEAYQPVHEEAACVCFSFREIVQQWKRCTPHRGWLAGILVLFAVGIVSGQVRHHHFELGHSVVPEAAYVAEEHGEGDAEQGHEEGWTWVRVTLLLVTLVGLCVVATVPDHFLDEHLWNHLVKVHVWKIFLWTVGALVVMHVLLERLDLGLLSQQRSFVLIAVACLVGLIPESGPHLIFVTLFADGAIPMSVLMANALVQDGHGMIPMLAHSRRAFLAVKTGKLVLGVGVGLLGYCGGW